MSLQTYPSAPDQMLDTAGDAASGQRFLHALTASRAWVITDKDWDGYGRPDGDIRLLSAADGTGQRQPMIAAFTRREYAEAYLQRAAAAGNRGFSNIAEPPMAWVLLGLPSQAGISINPGSDRSLRISPETSAEMRLAAQATLAQAHEGTQSSDPQPLLVQIQLAIETDDIAAAEAGIAELSRMGADEEYVLSSQALVAKYRSQYDQAAQLLRRAIEKAEDPVLAAEFWWILSQVHIDAHDADQAEHDYRQAIAADPEQSSYVVDFAKFLSERERADEALGMLNEQATLHPAEPVFAISIGRTYMDTGRYEQAIKIFDDFIARHPDLAASAYFNKAMCLQVIGKLDEAMKCLETALTMDVTIDGHHHYANLLKTAKKSLPASQKYIDLLQQRTQEEMPITSRIDSYYTLSKIHEAAGDFGRAFECLSRANSLKRSTLKWSIGKVREDFDRHINLVDRGFIDRFKGKGSSDLRPIFVLGMPRSGTTLTEQILAAHSEVNPGGELNHLTKLCTPFIERWSNAAPGLQGQDDGIVAGLREMADRYSQATLALQTGGRRFTDKMPGNYLYIGLIYLMFPGASVIHCRRNPVDNCLSCYERQFSKGLFFSYDLKELGGYYQLYRRVMRHWHEILPENFILDVDYEQMVADPENQIHRLLDFCGLEFEEACMNFHEVERSVKTASVLQVRQPMYKTSVAKWKKYGNQLAPLLEALGPELTGE